MTTEQKPGASEEDVDDTADDKTTDTGELTEPAEPAEPSAGSSEVVETAAADVESAEATVEPEPLARKGFARRVLSARVGAATLAILLVVAAGLTAWLYFKQYRPDQQTGPVAQQDAVKAATDGTVAVLSYGPDSLDKDLANAKSRLTGSFLNYYTEFTDSVVRPAVKQKQVKTDAKVIRAAVSDIQPNNATVLVFVNQTTLSTDRQDPALSASSVMVKLAKVDGNWLISEFNPV